MNTTGSSTMSRMSGRSNIIWKRERSRTRTKAHSLGSEALPMTHPIFS